MKKQGKDGEKTFAKATDPRFVRVNARVLQESRIRKALTQEELAERSGVDERTVKNLEQGGKRAQLRTVRSLAAALEVTPKEFIINTTAKPSGTTAIVTVILLIVGTAGMWSVLPSFEPVAPVQVRRSGRLLANLTREGGYARRISLGSMPLTSVLTPDDRELYVALRGGVITVIDTVGLRVTHRLQAGGEPNRFAVSPDGSQIYVGNNLDNVQVIDTATKTLRSINVGGRVSDLALSPDGRRLYIAMAYQGLKRLMTRTGHIVAVPGLVCPVSLAVDDKSNQMWVSCRCGGPGGRPGHDWVDILDLSSERSVGRVGGPPIVGGPIALSPDRSTVWIDGSDACFGPRYDHVGCPAVPSGVVHAIRTSDRTFLKSIAAPGQGVPLPLPDGSSVALATGGGIAVIDVASFRTMEQWDRRIPWVSFTHDGQRAFFSLANDNAIAESSPGGPACEPVPEGLRDYWNADGIADNLASARHGRMEKGAGFAPGLVGQAFSFDGEDDHIIHGLPGMITWQLPAPAILSLWVKFTRPVSREEVFLERRLTDGGLNWRMLRSPDGRVRFEAPAKAGLAVLSTQAPVPSDVWQHLTLVNTGSQIRVYLDGVRQSELDHRLAADGEGIVRLGGAATGGSFAGLIDEVTIREAALTDEQIHHQHRAFVSACVPASQHP